MHCPYLMKIDGNQFLQENMLIQSCAKYYCKHRGELIEFKRGGHKDMLKAYNAAILEGETPTSANAIAQRAVVWGRV